MTASEPLDHTSTAPNRKDGAYATYLVVPESAELLGARRPVEVSGTADGKVAAGDEVTVHLQQRLM